MNLSRLSRSAFISSRIGLAMILFATMVLSLARPEPAQAVVAAGFSEYYIPGFSDDLMAVLDAIETNNIGTQLTNITTISVGGDNGTVYYDHWENGYGTGTSGADETYPVSKGSVLTFRSTNIPYPRGTSLTACTGSVFPAGGTGGDATYCYDGRDRLYVAGSSVAVAQAYWPTTANTNYANAWEIYPVKPYQTTYTIPVGENLYAAGGSFADFFGVFVLAQATVDGTNIQIDDPGTAGVEVNVTRNRGETVRLDHIDTGTTVSASHPVQVHFIVGIAQQYNSRGFTAVPSSLWASSYYSPVPGNGGGYDTDLFIYNPTSAALTINYQDSLGSGSFSVAANATESYQGNVGRYVPQSSAVYLAAADGATKFWAIGSVDAGNSTYNYGFTLIPPQTLTDEYYASWAPGGWNQGTSTAQQANYSPVYVTPVQNDTTVFVDNSPTDGVVDQVFNLDRIQMQRIYDTSDADNTGLHIWATAPLAIVWGEDPSTSPTASPGLDAGYTILPLNQEWIDVVISLDKSVSPSSLPTGPGQTATFTLVTQSDAFGLTGATVVDTLPANWAYVNNSALITLPDGSPISGAGANPDIAGQTLTWNDFPVGGLNMNPYETLTIVFQATTVGTSATGYSTNTAAASATYNGQTFTSTDDARVYFSDLTVTKTANPAGAVNAGDTINYTIVVQNAGVSRQNNLVVTDQLPVGASYVANSAQVTRPTIAGTVGDAFNTQAYTGNQDSGAGDPSWNPAPGTWNELGEATNATGGDMQVLDDPAGAGTFELRIQGDGASQNGVYRDVDISSCTSAYLSLIYRRVGLENAADYVRLSVGINGAVSTTIYDFAGAASGATTDSAYQSLSANLGAYLDDNTRIQLQGPSTLAADDQVWFDNVLIECFSGTPTTSAAGAPPNLVTAANSYDLNTGQSLTVVYQARVDNPLPGGLVNVVNTVGVTSDEQPGPTWRTVINPVNTTNLAMIGSSVWLDEDGDGLQDAGEAGIPNVVVDLYDAGGTVLVASTVTDANGGYAFANLAPGTYQVNVNNASLPAGLVQSTSTGAGDGENKADPFSVTVAAGEENPAADFGFNWAPSGDVTGNTNSGAIGDRVWSDADGDGFQDAEEAGLAGVTVELVTAGPDGLLGSGDDLVVGTTTTTASGSFVFDGLPAGAYGVRIPTPPAGYTQTGDPDSSGSPCTTCDSRTTTPILLGPGDVYVNVDFGYQPQAGTAGSIGDSVWLDLDGDGVQDATEPGIPGVSVALIRDLDGDGAWDAGEPIIATDLTDASGSFLFSGLATMDGAGSDDYLVWVNDTGRVLGELTQTYDSNGLGTPNVSAATNLSPAGSANQDFGYGIAGQTAGEGLIGDAVFLDRDGDDRYDPGEGLEGVRVQLYTADGQYLLAETRTDENGRYAFGSLPAGTYLVRVDPGSLPAGLTNTADPDAGVSNQATVVLSSGQIDLDEDFGYRESSNPNSIGGSLWNDADGDGALDGDEAGRFAGVTVALYDSRGMLVGTTTTDASGGFSFNGLPDGDYRVDVTDEGNVLNGYWHTLGAAPGADNNSQAEAYTVTVSGGQANSTADFGYFINAAALGNFAWLDRDGDGLQDAGEPGLVGAVVTLHVTFPGGVTTTVNTQAGAAGFYTFGNLLLDENFLTTGSGLSYEIRMAPPGGNTPTVIDFNANSRDYEDSDDPAGVAATTFRGMNAAAQTPATSETIAASYDFGFVGNVSLGDFVWEDRDADGLQDGGLEAGISGATVTLTWAGLDGNLGTLADNLTFTTTTDANGLYTFSGLPAGTFSVDLDESTLPAGFVQTTSDPLTVSGLAAGSVYTAADFGARGVVTIGDSLWLDLDGYGSRDADEPGLPGVVVELSDGVCTTGVDCPTATTNASGAYSFANVSTGVYTVGVQTSSLPAGVSQTGDPDGVFDHQHQLYATTPGVTYDGVDFGYRGAASIGDRVWNDMDGDGAQAAGEGGVPGVAVWLDWNDDGVHDANEPVETTDANGAYTFAGLIAGTYRVRVDAASLPGGVSQTGDPDGSLDNATSVTLAATEAYTLADFGYQYPTLSISKTSSAAGTVSPGQTITYTIEVRNNTAARQTNIAVADDLPAGTSLVSGSSQVIGYRLATTTNTYRDNFDNIAYNNQNGSQNWAGDWIDDDTPPNNTANLGDVQVLADGTSQYVLRPGDNPVGNNNLQNGSAYRVAGDLSACTSVTLSYDYRRESLEAADHLYLDLSANGGTGWTDGVRDITNGADATYQGSGDIVVTDYKANLAIRFRSVYAEGAAGAPRNDRVFIDNVLVTCVIETLTPVSQAAGDPPGLTAPGDNLALDPGQSMFLTFRVTVADPTPAGLGSVDNTASVVSAQQGTSQTASTRDELPRASLGSQVWYDSNGNGVQDGGEPGVSGVSVSLYDPGPNGVIGGGDDLLVAVTTSDAGGGYLFSNLIADTYFVQYSLPSGYSFTGQDQGGNEALDSDANPASGQSGLTALTAGTTNPDVDAGLAGSQLDYGDLLAAYDNTVLGENGARHLIGTLRLGAGIAPDPEGQESPTASRDSFDDGVSLGAQPWVNGATVNLSIDLQGSTASGTASVGVWIDWNNNGFFELGDFSVCSGLTVGAVNACPIVVPGSGVYTVGQSVNMRVRAFDPASLPGGSLDAGDSLGLAANGEVEDYQWSFSPTAVTLVSFGAQPLGLPLAYLLGLALILGGLLLMARRAKSAD